MPRPMKDWLEWLLFELAAGYYSRKLATGPEADLRRLFAAAGLGDPAVERRRDGMVWFAKAFVPRC